MASSKLFGDSELISIILATDIDSSFVARATASNTGPSASDVIFQPDFDPEIYMVTPIAILPSPSDLVGLRVERLAGNVSLSPFDGIAPHNVDNLARRQRNATGNNPNFCFFTRRTASHRLPTNAASISQECSLSTADDGQ